MVYVYIYIYCMKDLRKARNRDNRTTNHSEPHLSRALTRSIGIEEALEAGTTRMEVSARCGLACLVLLYALMRCLRVGLRIHTQNKIVMMLI